MAFLYQRSSITSPSFNAPANNAAFQALRRLAPEKGMIRMALAWWQRGVVYQVYPRSFQDSDGNGTGDLRGILTRLDHLTWLGVDALWISPVYPSPMTDFGYDVSDYCNIDPLFGAMSDMDALIAATHQRGLKLILDYVPNHTSDQHPWFEQSRQNRSNAKHDWYIWRDAAPGGGPPNNWQSNFGGSGWTWDSARGQYYYHSFLPTQPDLDWRQPAVRAAMFDVLRFWLERGVDGFRVDVMWMMIKDDQFRDNPPDPNAPGRLLPLYTTDRPEVQDVVAAMRAVLDPYGDRVLIGELYLPIDRLVAYYGKDGRGAQLPFNFQLLLMQGWDATTIADIITRYEAALPPGAWPNWVLGNHDRPRIASRIGPAQGPRGGIAAAHPSRHPHALHGRRIGHAEHAHPPIRHPRPGRTPPTRPKRGPRSGAHPLPLAAWRRRRLHHRHPLAPHRSGHPAQPPARRPGLHAKSAPCLASPTPRPPGPDRGRNHRNHRKGQSAVLSPHHAGADPSHLRQHQPHPNNNRSNRRRNLINPPHAQRNRRSRNLRTATQ